MLGAIALVVLLAVKPFGRHRLERRIKGEPWACGYKFENSMTVSASGFTQPLRSMFAPAYRIRNILDPSHWMAGTLRTTTQFAKRIEPSFEVYLIDPGRKAISYLSSYASKVQGGDFRVYCIYMIVALLALLIIPFTSGVK